MYCTYRCNNDVRVSNFKSEFITLLCRAFITALANGNTIRVFKTSKKKDGTGTAVTGEFDFPVKHKTEIISIAIASNGKYIMSCSKDTTIIIWNLKGKLSSFEVIIE
jgi:WD40 repeat protein